MAEEIQLLARFKEPWYTIPSYLESVMPCTYVNGAGEKIPFSVVYNTILFPPRSYPGNYCKNQDVGLLGRSKADLEGYTDFENSEEELMYRLSLEISDKSGRPNAGHDLGIIYTLYWACRTSLQQLCDNTDCYNLKASLRNLMPPCRTWKGFESWILQIAACLCSQSMANHTTPLDSGLKVLVNVICRLVKDCRDDVLHSGTNSHSLHREYMRWEQSVDLFEVFDILSWLKGVSSGSYQFIHPENPLAKNSESMFSISVVEALERSASLGLCPQRVWGLAATLPHRELNLPAFIPTEDKQAWNHGNSHRNCALDFCEQAHKNFASVKQLHVCVDPQSPPTCLPEDSIYKAPEEKAHLLPLRSAPNSISLMTPPRGTPPAKMFSQDLLVNSLKAGRPTAWSLDGYTLVEPGAPFMAVSHVWSDGTGGLARDVKPCLWQFFIRMAKELRCAGVWWDTICIPNDTKKNRNAALNKMHKNYADAKVTLVHDLYLRNFSWDPEGACFAVVMSPWFSRGWTALELAKSTVVKVLFKNDVLKDLDRDILAKPGAPSSPCRQVSTTAVLGLRRGNLTDLDELLTSYGPRSTSWSRDRAIIAGLLVGIEEANRESQQEIYQSILKILGRVSTTHLFHGRPTMSNPAFSWCPTNLLDISVGTGSIHSLSIQGNGDVVGYWDLSCISLAKDCLEFVWEDTDPLLRAKLQSALIAKDKHLLLTEESTARQTRGIIVKLMGKLDAEGDAAKCLPEICGSFVGSVVFRNRPGSSRGDIGSFYVGHLGQAEVRIGDTTGMVEISKGESACQYATKVWNKRQAHSPTTPVWSLDPCAYTGHGSGF